MPYRVNIFSTYRLYRSMNAKDQPTRKPLGTCVETVKDTFPFGLRPTFIQSAALIAFDHHMEQSLNRCIMARIDALRILSELTSLLSLISSLAHSVASQIPKSLGAPEAR